MDKLYSKLFYYKTIQSYRGYLLLKQNSMINMLENCGPVDILYKGTSHSTKVEQHNLYEVYVLSIPCNKGNVYPVALQ